MTFVHESNGRFSLVEFTHGRQKIFINRSAEHPSSYKMFCAIWCHLCNLKNMKSTHGGMLLLKNLLAEAEAWNLTNCNTPPWVFFTFFKLYKWYWIMQSIIYNFNKFSKKTCQNSQKSFYFFPANFSLKKYELLKLHKIFTYKNFKCMCSYFGK